MPVIWESPHYTAGLRRLKWIVWALLAVAVVALGWGVVRGDIAGGFTRRGTSGTYAKLLFTLHTGMDPTSVAWSPDGKYIATASADDSKDVEIWDVPQRKLVKVWPIPFGTPTFHELAFSPDGKYLAVCDSTGVLRVYDTGTRAVAHVFSGFHASGGCDHPVFSSDSQRLAAGLGDLKVVSVPRWQIVRHLVLNSGRWRGDLFKALAYLPGTRTVLAGGGQTVEIPYFGKMADSSVGCVWFFGPEDRVPSRTVRVYRAVGDHGGGGDVTALTTSPDGRYLVTGAMTGGGSASTDTLVTQSVHIVRTSDGALVAAPLDALPALKFGNATAIAYTHDGRYIVVPHEVSDGWVHVLDGHTFKVLDVVRTNAYAFDVAVNAVNDDFAVATGNRVMVWSLPDR